MPYRTILASAVAAALAALARALIKRMSWRDALLRALVAVFIGGGGGAALLYFLEWPGWLVCPIVSMFGLSTDVLIDSFDAVVLAFRDRLKKEITGTSADPKTPA